MITRSFDQGEKADSQNKNNVIQRNGSQERHSRCSPTVLEMVRYTAGSRTAVNEKWAADRAVTDHGDLTVKLTADTLRLQMNHVRTKKGILVQKKSSVIGGRRIFLTKMHYHRRQGYLPKLVTKMNEIPTTFESSVVK